MSKPDSQILESAWGLIDGADTIAVLMHVNPDGDALGSGIAITLTLRGLGKSAHLVCRQVVPDIYQFLNHSDVLTADPPHLAPDLVILVDCDRVDRVDSLEHLALAAKKSLVLDHHPGTSEFGDVRVTQTDCAATAEIVYWLMYHRGIEPSERAAEALMVALMTDTGGFRFANTTSDTFRIAAKMSDIGVKSSDVSVQVFESRTYQGLQLLGRALSSIHVSPKGSVVLARLSLKDFEETGARPEDTEGFVNLVHSVRGSDVAALLREEAPERVRVSMRSRGGTPVKGAAEALGGGGHELAAACLLEMNLDKAEEAVVGELKKWMDF